MPKRADCLMSSRTTVEISDLKNQPLPEPIEVEFAKLGTGRSFRCWKAVVNGPLEGQFHWKYFRTKEEAEAVRTDVQLHVEKFRSRALKVEPSILDSIDPSKLFGGLVTVVRKKK